MATLDQTVQRPDDESARPVRLAVADLPLSALRIPPQDLRGHGEPLTWPAAQPEGALADL